ncbi:MAG: hypothetical protein Q4F88_02410, partial [Eubacteriales bacterium]|nr:hypothetical protein [Eubacteriales bacterium]
IILLYYFFSFILHFVFSSYLDKTKKITPRIFVFILTLINSILLIFLYFLKIKFIISIFFISLASLFITLQGIINAICFQYERDGLNINYTIARALGSISFAFASLFIGQIINLFKVRSIPLISFCLMLLFLILIYLFKIKSEKNANYYSDNITEEKSNIEKNIKNNDALNLFDFFKKYKGLLLFSVGLTFILSSHQSINNYLILIMNKFGAGSKEVGECFFLAALLESIFMLYYKKIEKKIQMYKHTNFFFYSFYYKNYCNYICK